MLLLLKQPNKALSIKRPGLVPFLGAGAGTPFRPVCLVALGAVPEGAVLQATMQRGPAWSRRRRRGPTGPDACSLTLGALSRLPAAPESEGGCRKQQENPCELPQPKAMRPDATGTPRQTGVGFLALPHPCGGSPGKFPGTLCLRRLPSARMASHGTGGSIFGRADVLCQIRWTATECHCSLAVPRHVPRHVGGILVPLRGRPSQATSVLSWPLAQDRGQREGPAAVPYA